MTPYETYLWAMENGDAASKEEAAPSDQAVPSAATHRVAADLLARGCSPDLIAAIAVASVDLIEGHAMRTEPELLAALPEARGLFAS